jgi:hypothetical protein
MSFDLKAQSPRARQLTECSSPNCTPRSGVGDAREAHRSRPRRRPRPRESLLVANWVGIGSMCSVCIAPALRVGDAFRARLATSYPGLKPWAILSDHFMVKNQLPRFLNIANLLIRKFVG